MQDITPADPRRTTAGPLARLPSTVLRLPRELRRLMVGVAAVITAVVVVQHWELTLSYPLTRHFLVTQDAPVFASVCAGMLLIAWMGVPSTVASWSVRTFSALGPWLGGLVACAGVVVVVGTPIAAFDFPYSRDEIMALFDASIIATGQLIGPVPAEWRPFVPALQPVFRLPVPDHVAWISTYLPGNAALRGLLGLAFDRPMVNAVLVVSALMALWGVVRQLWPDRLEAQLMAVLLATTSSQTLFMGMTPYAMTAHLLLNLVWLWLFLRNTTASHIAALAVGFLATGLHQLVFHPLFVAPFVLMLAIDRRYGLFLAYSAGYAVIGVFWIVYWQLLLAGSGAAAPGAASAMGMAYFVERVSSMLANMYPSAFETMIKNVLRFLAWQNPLMLVLIGPGLVFGWRAGGVMRALVAGIALTLFAMLVLLPYQDIGWGYRYAHGLIGSAAVLSALGWITLADRWSVPERTAAWGVVGVAAVVATVVLVPIHGWQMRAAIEPYARADAAIRAMPADVVAVESHGIHYGTDLVRNDRLVSNRPVTVDLGSLSEALVLDLCRRFDRVMVFDAAMAAGFGIPTNDPRNHIDHDAFSKLRAMIEGPTCRAQRTAGISQPR